MNANVGLRVVERAVTPAGIKILLEEWDDGFAIGAYPVAKNSRSVWTTVGKSFRLTISNNKYKGYTNEDVKADYEALKNGSKRLEDLSDYFWCGREDMYQLGMIAYDEI